MDFDWFNLENSMGEKLPPCLKKILSFCAYDSINSLKQLNVEKVIDMEQYVSDYGHSILSELSCCHSEKYKSQKKFKFLPGHRSILLCLSHIIENSNIDEKDNYSLSNGTPNESFSTILSELTKTAENNYKKPKNNASYCDTVRYFSTYIYLLGGKSCYETLQRNLPIPSTKTIRK